ncbi:T9SS type A sorting domain-containing protein [bacterium]|nr:T9SS type A sorting domain-containing protein [bacterium]
MKRTTLLLIALFSIAAAGNPDGIEITRLLDGMPDNQTYAEYLAERTPPGEANFTTVYQSLTTGAGDDIYVLVDSALYSGISANLSIWVSDLEAESYTVTVATSGTITPQTLRANLQTRWAAGMDGVVLIGEFDSAWFQGIFWTDIGYEEFPCDLYLTDLDGDWQDQEDASGAPNPDGIYDYHEDGSGDMEPDIYLGRVTAYNLSLLPSTEVDIVNAWLTRVHNWHNGGSGMPTTSLTYVDHDWRYSGWGSDVDLLYSTENESFYWPNVDRSDYYSRLENEPREHMLLCCHSGPMGHFFHTGGHAAAYLILAKDPQISFYNLFACSNARYTEQNLGALYSLGTDQGLLSVGSTKTGAMLEFDDFYSYLAGGMSWGDAFKTWHAYVAEGEAAGWDQQSARGWFYGMTLIGDPTLMPTNNSAVEVVSFTADSVDEGALLSWSVEDDGNLLGFNLYRGDGERLSAGRTKLNSSLISGDGVIRYLDSTDATGRISYYLEAVEAGGETTVFGPAVCNLYGEVAVETRLVGVYPNPVSGTAAVELEIAEAGVAELTLYDLAGRRVDTIHVGELTSGRHSFSVDGSTLTDGVYLLRLTSGSVVSTQRLVVVR